MRLKPGHRERRYRHTEALLLLLVLLILAVGGALALTAQGLTAPPATAIDINRSDSAALARTLGVPAEVGKRIVAERASRFDHSFPDVDSLGRVALVPDVDAAARKMRESGARVPRDAATDQLKSLSSLSEFARKRLLDLVAQNPEASWERILSLPLVPAERLRAAEPNLIVRPWKAARSELLLYLGGFVLFALIGHVWLRRAYPGADPFLLPITLLLSGLGVLLLFAIKDPTRDMPTYAGQAQGVLIGGAIALLFALARPVARLPLHRYGYLYALAAVFGTVVLGLVGSGPGGVKLSVAGTQPVEIIKVLMVLFLAAYLAERGPLLNDPLRKFGPFPLPRRRDAAPLIVLYALPLALFAIVRDLGPVLLLFGAFLLLIYLATGRAVYVVLGLAALLLGGTLGYLLKFGVFETRVLMWLSPWDNSKSLGDHLARGLWGMSSGGVVGSGLGLGGSRYIPRGGSDLALAALGEEAGLPATLAVIACFLALVARGLTIARNASTDFDRLLAAGLSGLLGIQAIIILFGTLGLLPLAGITLPFVSYGKSSLIASFFMIGLLLLISARAPAATAPAAVPPSDAYLLAARRVGVVFAILLGIVGVLRLVFVQGVGADVLASRMVYVPDADGVKRPHINPRLAEIARAIPRGRILDRAGQVLAETRGDERRRVYPLGEATGHLVGYLDGSIGGPTGFEERFNDTLRGFATYRSLLPYWRMKDQPGFRLPRGEDVITSLDSDLQKAALASLKQRTGSLRDRRNGRPKRRAAAVVLDTRTGEVLAAATLPTYDPNGLTPARMRALNANEDGDFPLINRAISGYYPPGSTFKIVTASAQFANDRADYTVTCGHVATNVIWSAGGQTYARRRIVDDESERPHGLTNLTVAVAESCNVYFARAGIALGPKALREHVAEYGFAKLPTAVQFDASLPEIAFGQAEMLASPLEMANVAQAIANGGNRITPQFVKGGSPTIAATPLSSNDAARLADMMRRVTVSGTAAGRFNDLPFSVAGKTGTAQNDRYDRVSHSWFIGFAPVETPKVAFAVIVENGGYGAQAAVPISRDLLRATRP